MECESQGSHVNSHVTDPLPERTTEEDYASTKVEMPTTTRCMSRGYAILIILERITLLREHDNNNNDYFYLTIDGEDVQTAQITKIKVIITPQDVQPPQE